MRRPRPVLLTMATITWWAVSGAAVPAECSGLPAPEVFLGATTAGIHRLTAAQFSPSVAPVVSRSKVAKDMHLSWQEVTIAPGATIEYTVIRWRNGANPVAVCTGATAPVVAGGMVSCIDPSPPNGSLTYSEQPVVVRDGTPTWTLPASVPA